MRAHVHGTFATTRPCRSSTRDNQASPPAGLPGANSPRSPAGVRALVMAIAEGLIEGCYMQGRCPENATANSRTCARRTTLPWHMCRGGHSSRNRERPCVREDDETRHRWSPSMAHVPEAMARPGAPGPGLLRVTVSGCAAPSPADLHPARVAVRPGGAGLGCRHACRAAARPASHRDHRRDDHRRRAWALDRAATRAGRHGSHRRHRGARRTTGHSRCSSPAASPRCAR